MSETKTQTLDHCPCCDAPMREHGTVRYPEDAMQLVMKMRSDLNYAALSPPPEAPKP